MSDVPVESVPVEDEGVLTNDQGTETELYTIRHNGQDRQVSFEQLVELAQQGFDYTQKTQKLSAQQREAAIAIQLMEALEKNPTAVIKELGKMYGAQVEDDSFVDPTEAKVREIEARLAAQQRVLQANAIRQEAATALAKHNVNADVDQLLQFAHENGIVRLDSAAKVFKHEQAERQQQVERERALAAKRGASVVEGGTSASRQEPGTQQVNSLDDAVRLAMQGIRK